MSWPFGDFATIVQDPGKGRCLRAGRAFAPGELVWVEEAYVFAGADEEDPDEIRADLSLWREIVGHCTPKPKKAVSDEALLGLMDSLISLETVSSADTARCLLQLALRAIKSGRDQKIDNSTNLFLQLQPSNLESCIEDISTFRAQHPRVFPPSLTSELLGRILGVLNNNQMELEDIIGSGLFVATAIVEHNCLPSCSFTTSKNYLYMTAVQHIKEGDRFSIDYGNNYCRPTFYRRAYLYKTYGFFCECSACCGSDRSRSFKCPWCKEGAVFAMCSDSLEEMKDKTISTVSSGADPDMIFVPGFDALTACDRCNALPLPDYVLQAAAFEERIAESGLVQSPLTPSSVSDFAIEIERLRQQNDSLLHETHFLLFWAVDKLAEYLSSCANMKAVSFSDALGKAIEVSRLLDSVLPPLHHEKVLSYDKVAQLAVAAEKIDLAKEYFRRAFEMSCAVCTPDMPLTKKLLALATETPASVGELRGHYNLSEPLKMSCKAASHIADSVLEEDELWEDDDDDLI